VTCDHLLQYCAPNKTEIKKAVLIEYAFHFVAGDLYPLAFGSNSLDLGTVTLKADSLKKLNPLGGFDRICILGGAAIRLLTHAGTGPPKRKTLWPGSVIRQ
jgi:hypothetical protein